MTRRIVSVLFVSVFAGVFAFGGLAHAERGRYGKQKVVYHLNHGDAKQQKVALRNIQNHINALGQGNVTIKVVHGAGVSMLVTAKSDVDLRRKISQLKLREVSFQVCHNTLRGKKFDYKKDLFDVGKSDIVPSGVAEIARLQQMGYVYIKP